MTVERLHELFERHKEYDVLEWEGKCRDCEVDVEIKITVGQEGFEISGGAIYEIEPDKFYFKCNACFEKNPALTHFQECEVYSRVVGYLRPVKQFNPGKREEFKDRVNFKIGAI